MKRSRNIRLLVSLTVLIAAIAATVLVQQGQSLPAVDPGLFHVDDPTAIDHISLESGSGKVDIRFDGTRWKVNGKYDADPRLIDIGGRGIFFATLQQAIAKRPVARQQADSVNARLDRKGVNVQLFTGSVLKEQFQAGGNASRTEAYFRAHDSREPVLMTIPGYRVYVSQVFELGENGWRDLRVFNFNWRNFKSLHATFPADPHSDFEISRQGGIFGVAGMDDADTAKVNTFLDDISLLIADQVAGSTVRKWDSLARTIPLVTITVTDIANRRFALDVFAPLRQENQVEGRAFDNEKVLFDRKKIQRIFKKRTYFRPR